jgi:hypothetical protein
VLLGATTGSSGGLAAARSVTAVVRMAVAAERERAPPRLITHAATLDPVQVVADLPRGTAVGEITRAWLIYVSSS